MKRSLIPAALLVLLAAGACGERQAVAPEIPAGADPSARSVTLPTKPTAPPTDVAPPVGPVVSQGPTGVVVPPGYTEVPPGQVDAKGLPADIYTEHRVWVSEDGRSLQLFAVAPDPCTAMEAVIKSADGAAVTVGLAPMAKPHGGPEGQVCATVLTMKPVLVPLAETLDNRTVVLTLGP